MSTDTQQKSNEVSEAAKKYAEKYKTQVSSEGLENIANDFIEGAKWYAKQHPTTSEPIKDEELDRKLHDEIYNSIADNIGNIVIAPTVKRCIEVAKQYAENINKKNHEG